MKSFLSLIIILIITLTFASCSDQDEETPTKEKVKDGVLIHISHGTDNPQRVLMALNMAATMSVDYDVIVYFDIKGVDVVLKDSPDLELDPFGSSKLWIHNLLNEEITIMVCQGCLRAAGKLPEDLTEGITVADKDKFFSFTKGRILTIDY